MASDDSEGVGDIEGIFEAEEGDFDEKVGLREEVIGDAELFVSEDESGR